MIRSTNRASWHRWPFAVLAMTLLPASAVAGDRHPREPEKTVSPTSRMVVEKQLDARATQGTANAGGAEARRIYDLYLSRIGIPVETKNTISGPNGGQ